MGGNLHLHCIHVALEFLFHIVGIFDKLLLLEEGQSFQVRFHFLIIGKNLLEGFTLTFCCFKVLISHPLALLLTLEEPFIQEIVKVVVQRCAKPITCDGLHIFDNFDQLVPLNHLIIILRVVYWPVQGIKCVYLLSE